LLDLDFIRVRWLFLRRWRTDQQQRPQSGKSHIFMANTSVLEEVEESWQECPLAFARH
jgi:hypothetical protein